jgi:hypothetical protein
MNRIETIARVLARQFYHHGGNRADTGEAGLSVEDYVDSHWMGHVRDAEEIVAALEDRPSQSV